MSAFNYFQPTEIIFGEGRVREAGTVVARHGARVQTRVEGRHDTWTDARSDMVKRKYSLEEWRALGFVSFDAREAGLLPDFPRQA